MDKIPSMENIDIIDKLSKTDLLKLVQTVLAKKEHQEEQQQEEEKEQHQFPTEQKPLSPIQQSSPLKISISTPIKPLQEPFELPIENVITKLNQIQNSVSLLGNNDKKLNVFYNSLISLSDNFINDLNTEQDKLNNDFIKSLETITKIFSITSRFKPIESINESVLNPKIRNIINNYISNSFKSLDYYCSDNLSMYDLNNLIEEDLIRLIPILSQQLLTFNKQLKKFYSLYDLIDDYTNIIDESFMSKLPTKSDIKLFNEINQATDIKLILQTNFNQINPDLIKQLDSQIIELNQFILSKCNDLKQFIIKITDLNHELYREEDEKYLKLPSYINNDDMVISKIGISASIFERHTTVYNNLLDLKRERQSILDSYLTKVEQLWSILRPNSNEIQTFLKVNKNLYLDSFDNFDTLMTELEREKLDHIKEFIYAAREKINGFWDILMYDEESRMNYADFYINDESRFDEDLLDSHTAELDKLRNEVETLKPLLNLISNLNELIEEKKDLDESAKNPSRLLKRNSFHILKQEERTRSKLSKKFPLVIKELREKITEFENTNNRDFKLNGERYIDKLDEIEDFCVHSRRSGRSASYNLSTAASVSKSNPSSTVRRNTSNINKKNMKNVQTPSHSIIRKRNPDQMTNPFISRDPTPLKNRNSSPSLIFTSSSKATTPQSLSTEPIILRGRSPAKNKLNLMASKMISTIKPVESPNFQKLPSRSPMTIINRSNQTNIPLNIQSSSKKLNSIPVEELSDSFLDYSDNENVHPAPNYQEPLHRINKENKNPVTLSTITKTLGEQTQHFNLSLDSETF